MTADLVILLVIWGLGGVMAGGPPPGARVLRRVSGSFRGRVTIALFLFFLLPTSIFGTFAFRSLSSLPEVTASVLAERAVETGARAFFDLQGELDPLSQRAGSELLLFQSGALAGGSSPDLLALGLYEGILPRNVHETFARGEALLISDPARLGRWEYVVAFRRVAGNRILAAPASIGNGPRAPVPLEIGELLGFALLVGAALSLALALLVGRALSRPLHTLLVASERVGEGNLAVRLPGQRPDEFGAVFSAFNRMVRRLGTAREELVRTTRRTEAIVEEAAAGVVALDQDGTVTLANPRARALLGEGLELGGALPAVAGTPGEVAAWVERYFRDGLVEATGEFQFNDRRIRIRARRISREGPLSGAVMILEDVTDELRSERVLAWGQMARQVAHEVKNPLTPMKLSIQHVRRAWLDGRPDFGDILDRNAEAVLREIDRLAGISSSFSRLGPPGAGLGATLEPVEVGRVIEEVLALYSAGDGSIEFRGTVEPGLPPVLGREQELKEVLINLLENARAAVEDRGEVEISARSLGEEVEITVRDDGPGIPDELLPRIFEPHFSTRTGGTGLGLAIVDRLVRSWGGTVAASSDEESGTLIRLALPVAPPGGDGGPDGDRRPVP
jgi:signal transduction histidine kinase